MVSSPHLTPFAPSMQFITTYATRNRSSLAQLPIHQIDENNAEEKAKHDLIVRWVEEIMKANAKLTEARNDSDVEFWTNKCQKLESDINTAVYSLYALTPEEVRLIENS